MQAENFLSAATAKEQRNELERRLADPTPSDEIQTASHVRSSLDLASSRPWGRVSDPSFPPHEPLPELDMWWHDYRRACALSETRTWLVGWLGGSWTQLAGVNGVRLGVNNIPHASAPLV
ncbi:hypothetical protein TWF694_005954 [Orbilia ellipsospora]|uniref:Uncharacterized protein n=1 Tax=Orbilia ellipsospora TaxID=2528407 RepID=A0AAV9WTG6_9PEZI